MTRSGSDGIERHLAAILPADAVGCRRLIAEGERIDGDGVNIAARLERLAEPGGVCVSGPVHEQVESGLEVDWLERFIDGLRQAGLPEE